MTEPAEPPRCCGQQPASTRGGPIALVCLLCELAPNYWRREPDTAARLAAAAERYAATGSRLP